MEQWRKFHCDMKDLGSWLSEAETKLHETRNANGDLIVSVARTVQKVCYFIFLILLSVMVYDGYIMEKCGERNVA